MGVCANERTGERTKGRNEQNWNIDFIEMGGEVKRLKWAILNLVFPWKVIYSAPSNQIAFDDKAVQ